MCFALQGVLYISRVEVSISCKFRNCNIEITIMYSEKEFSKNSSLITRNAVSNCIIEIYSVDVPYTTRHHTHHPNKRILLRMWMLYA